MECQEGREGLWTGRFKQRKEKQHTAPHKMPRGKTLHHGRVKTQTRTPREEHQRKKHTSCVQNSIQKDSPRSTKEQLKQKPETIRDTKKVAAALPFLDLATWHVPLACAEAHVPYLGGHDSTLALQGSLPFKSLFLCSTYEKDASGRRQMK